MSKRALVIASADSIYTRGYIQHVLLPAGYQVTLFPIWKEQGGNDALYRQLGVTVYQDRHTLPVIRHIPRLRMWARIWRNAGKLRQMGPFEVVHNHYPSQRDLALGGAVAKAFGATWVVSFWGSDLLRQTPRHLARMKPYLARCRAVTIHSASQREVVERVFGPDIEAKTHLTFFGMTFFEEMDKVRKGMSQGDCKAFYGIPPDKKAVCIGYSASAAQNQQKVLRAMAALPPPCLAGLVAVLQLSYGATDPAYLREVEEAAAALPCQSVTITEFLDGPQSAKLRLAADVFILAIETDALSGSLREYLYAGPPVLVGSWLRYPELEEMGIDTIPFTDYGELPGLLETALRTSVSPGQQEKRAQLKARYSWDAVREGWLQLYS